MTTEQLEILADLWAASRSGLGAVLNDDAIPAAHQLAEQGWLRREVTDDTDQLCWFFSEKAEVALQLTVAAQNVN